VAPTLTLFKTRFSALTEASAPSITNPPYKNSKTKILMHSALLSSIRNPNGYSPRF
jgi:hypothetical protein